MADITTDNINTIAELAASIGDGDYIFIYKAGSNAFSKIEKSVFFHGISGGTDISDVLSNDWNDSSRQHVPSARQMNLMYNNLVSAFNSLSALSDALANSAFSSTRPTVEALDWVGSSSAFGITYNLTHCSKTQASPTSVAEGDSFTAVIVPNPGFTLDGVTASGSGFTQTYDSENDKITISASNVSNNITIGCLAVTFSVSVTYDLTGFSAESNIQYPSGGAFTKVLSPNEGYAVKSISITMNDVNITTEVWDASTRTISIPVVTGDIYITATAEESTAHTIQYKLTGCTKTIGPSEVEDGESLSVTFAKDTANWYGEDVKDDFYARDFVVYMGGVPLERIKGGVGDFSAEQSGTNVTININSVTANVEIVNIVWKRQYILCDDYDNTDAGEAYSTNARSVHTSTYIPVASNCEKLYVYGYNTQNGTSTAVSDIYKWGCAVYDSDKTFIKGLYLTKDECAFDLMESNVRIDADFIRTSAYLTTSPSGQIGRINHCYIYDITNNKFVWYGESVNRATIRTNHQSEIVNSNE